MNYLEIPIGSRQEPNIEQVGYSNHLEHIIDEIPDYISICSECGRYTHDDKATNWDANADPYCPPCYKKLTKEI